MGGPCALGGQRRPAIQAGMHGKSRRRTQKRRGRKTLGDATPPPPVLEFFMTLTVQKLGPSSRFRLLTYALPKLVAA
eukprot:3679765-Pyramimonas_sp.AAC.1